MLEDCAIPMEKKPLTRSGQAQGCESKKTQDVVGSKPISRSSRRREPSNSSTIKYESTRKPVPQKSKSFDKRPRPRGQYNGGGKEDSQVVPEYAAEYGSVFVPGSKKQNLNHLLNFHYAPRASATTHVPVSEWGRSQRWLPSTHKHKYNKEHFLQANCQFVVKSSGDYSAYLSSPDTLVDWDLVEQIRVQSNESLSCPICLCPPVAGKMTRCGHVFCWSCILHYLALSDKTWRSCPICYEAVHKNALRSVVAAQHCAVSVGDEVTMLLMCRPRDSLVATPIGQADRANGQILSVSETAVDTIYSKLLLATPAEVADLLAMERAQLEQQLREEQGCPEMCFTEQALQLLAERVAALTVAIGNEPATDDVQLVTVTTDVKYAEKFECEVSGESESLGEAPLALALPDEAGVKRERYVSVSSSDTGSAVFAAEDLEIHHPQAAPQKIFYFYQASDGQHVYLHAVNVRMLEMQYGSLAQCPPVIRGRVLEKEAGSMSAELRRRLRYLQHLSVACPFEVAEIELRPPIMQPLVLQHFQEQLDTRRRRRASRAKQERRREKQISVEEDRRMGRHPTARVRIQSTRHFPQWGAEASVISASPRSLSPAESSVASSPRDPVSPLAAAVAALDIVQPPPEPPQEPLYDAAPGFSFARMLREGKSKPGSAAAQSRPAWPVAAARPRRASDSEPEPEGYVPAPSFSQSFSNAIAFALEKAEAQVGSEGVSGKQKKKKKNKKTLLFTTTMACTGK